MRFPDGSVPPCRHPNAKTEDRVRHALFLLTFPRLSSARGVASGLDVGANKVLDQIVVLDRDYMTVPAVEIRHIKPVMTMVGGRVVYKAAR